MNPSSRPSAPSPVPIHLTEENGFTLSGAEVEAAITRRTRLIFLNFPSNPTGGVASKEQLGEIAEVILRKGSKDLRVYADEVYEHILFDGSRHQSIASFPGMAERTIIVGGASKSFSWTGGRLGWAMFPTLAEAEMFRNLAINFFSCVSGLQPGRGAARARVPTVRRSQQPDDRGVPGPA